MSFVAYGFLSEKKVTVHTLSSAAAHLSSALSKDNIEVMHASEKGDHRWKKLTYSITSGNPINN